MNGIIADNISFGLYAGGGCAVCKREITLINKFNVSSK
jgi:hypothetical protein